MSQRPVGPREFNPVLGASLVGVAVAAKVMSGILDAIQDHSFIKHKLVPRCYKVIRLSNESRDRMVAMAETFHRTELQNARQRLTEVANEMHERFSANFEPEAISMAVRDARAAGERPEQLMDRWCQELVARPLWCMDKIQSVRMAGREHRTEWRALEDFKQEIVDLWGKELIDVSRSEGRERNYMLWQALRAVMKFSAAVALTFGAFVLVVSL